MGAHKMRRDKGLPPAFIEMVRGKEPASVIAERFGMKEGAVRAWRVKLRQEAEVDAMISLHESHRRSQPATEEGQEEKCGITPRMAEVFSRPRTLGLLAALYRESPRGACVVCWRDVRGGKASAEALACTRTKPGTTSSPCNAFVEGLKRRAETSQERAKVSLLMELGAVAP
jgi:hypothetical protein